MELTVTNPSTRPVQMHRVRLEGEVMGLNLLTYDVRVLVDLQPGESRTVEVPLDFFDLERQANGFLRAHLRTYDGERARLSSDEFVVDIRGSWFSTMVGFAVLLIVGTAVVLALNLRDLGRGRLPANRVKRGLRFGVPGLGVGLVLAVGLSVLRIYPLPAAGWIPLVLIPTAIGFGVGFFLTPTPSGADDGDDDADDLDDELLLAEELAEVESQLLRRELGPGDEAR